MGSTWKSLATLGLHRWVLHSSAGQTLHSSVSACSIGYLCRSLKGFSPSEKSEIMYRKALLRKKSTCSPHGPYGSPNQPYSFPLFWGRGHKLTAGAHESISMLSLLEKTGNDTNDKKGENQERHSEGSPLTRTPQCSTDSSLSLDCWWFGVSIPACSGFWKAITKTTRTNILNIQNAFDSITSP